MISPLRPLQHLAPGSPLDLGIVSDSEVQPSWPAPVGHMDFHITNNHSLSEMLSLSPQYSSFQSVKQEFSQLKGFDLQKPCLNNYQGSYSYRHGLIEQLPTVSSPQSQQDSAFEQLKQDQELLARKSSSRDLQVRPSMVDSTTKNTCDQLEMIKRHVQQQIKMKLETRKVLTEDMQTSLPNGAKVSSRKFANNIVQKGSHSDLVSRGHQLQQQPFAQGLVSMSQPHDFKTGAQSTRGLSGSSFSVGASMSPEDFEATVMKQFQEKVFQLDVGTKMGLQDSLHRLATSVREQQKEIALAHISAETDYAAVLGTDLDASQTWGRIAASSQSRSPFETNMNRVDRIVLNMLFSPLRLAGRKYPPEHLPPSRLRTGPVEAGSRQAKWMWSANSRAESSTWASPSCLATNPGNASISHVQCDHRGSGFAPVQGRIVTPTTTWTVSPLLTDYKSPSGTSSPSDDPSLLPETNLSYTASGAQLVRGPGGNGYTASQALEINAPRQSDSTSSSMTTDQSFSSGHSGQVLTFGDNGFNEPSSYGSQDTCSFVSGGQRTNHIAASGHGADQHLANHKFSLMNVNDDILGAALSIQSRSVSYHDELLLPPLSSATPNATANSSRVGFSPLLYDGDSHFSSSPGMQCDVLGRSSTGMGFFQDQRNTSMRNIVSQTMAHS